MSNSHFPHSSHFHTPAYTTSLLRPHQPLQPTPQRMLEPKRIPPQPLRNTPRRPRNKHMPTPPTQNLLHNPLRHRLRIQKRIQKRILRRQIRNQRRPRKSLRNKHSTHPRRLIPRHQLRRQTLMERNRRSLARRVIHHIGRDGVSGLRGDCHDHAVVGGDHVGQEFLREPVV